MKLTLGKNWIAKILSLLLAIAIWFLIKDHLATGEGPFSQPPRAIVVPDIRRRDRQRAVPVLARSKLQRCPHRLHLVSAGRKRQPEAQGKSGKAEKAGEGRGGIHGNDSAKARADLQPTIVSLSGRRAQRLARRGRAVRKAAFTQGPRLVRSRNRRRVSWSSIG